MDNIQNTFTVIANEPLSPRFLRMRIDAPSLVRGVRPGQFIHIRVSDGLAPFFRRPFSVYRARKDLEIFYEVVGPGTALLAAKQPGDPVDVLGPLGTPFVLPGPGVRQVVMVAGGIGIAPFLILSDVLKERRDLKLVLLYGGRTKDHVYPMKEFRENGCEIHVATDDGSVGHKGYVPELFSRVVLAPQTTRLYTCGPNRMMAAVQKFAREQGLEGQAACEEVMACGLGACLGCSIPTTKGYKTVCHDGPAFNLDEVVFERAA